jgi:diadenosine tetraphosphate (Ap4A) HIT family hydrolase
MERGEFFAMLGLGPVGEGYSLIASKSHCQSMLDLTEDEATQLEDFTQEVRDRVSPLFGECSIGEHGRVALCVGQVTSKHEPHCMHAHRLIFPGLAALPLSPAASDLSR